MHLTLNVAETSKMLTDAGFTRWVALGDGSMCVKNMDVLDVEERGEKERGKLLLAVVVTTLHFSD